MARRGVDHASEASSDIARLPIDPRGTNEPYVAMSPVLVTQAGLARRWGISLARIAELIAQEGFPEPVKRVGVANYALYDVVKCERWRKVGSG